MLLCLAARGCLLRLECWDGGPLPLGGGLGGALGGGSWQPAARLTIPRAATCPCDRSEAFQTFDYITEHGNFSWVNREAGERVLAAAAFNCSISGLGLAAPRALLVRSPHPPALRLALPLQPATWAPHSCGLLLGG